MEKIPLDNLCIWRENAEEMSIHRESVLLSAAGYLCSAVEDLRRGGYEAFADQIVCLIAHLDAEFVLSREDSLRDRAAP